MHVYQLESQSQSDWQPYYVPIPGDEFAPVRRYDVCPVWAPDAQTAFVTAAAVVHLFETSWRKR